MTHLTQVGENQQIDSSSDPLKFIFKAKQATCADAYAIVLKVIVAPKL